MDQLEISRSIAADSAPLRQMFWDIRRWQAVWNPIEAIQVLYDDGLHQEFLMEVWRGGLKETIRTIRFREADGSIGFFSPLPPPMMDSHRGAWIFAAEPGGCRLTATRTYALTPLPEERPEDYRQRCVAFKESFAVRLAAILERFADYFATPR